MQKYGRHIVNLMQEGMRGLQNKECFKFFAFANATVMLTDLCMLKHSGALSKIGDVSVRVKWTYIYLQCSPS